VNDGLLNWLENLPLKTVVVIHANHPYEIDAGTKAACESLKGIGVTLLNQSVLLAGVNDDADVLVRLSETLFEAGVLPYYLHLLDKVHGAAHFEVDTARALELHAALVARLPGYLVPRLVREIPGEVAKSSVHA
jgi:L-lysine 2,3-aminomutase